jgi:FMN-dependent oxidoreductase (nitrilotriacetate monooxygenase family)
VADKRQLHLSAILLNSIAPIPDGMWTHPRARNFHDFASAEYWEEIGRILERGLFDAVFLADLLHPHETYRGSIEPTLRYGAQAPVHDPLVVVPIVARATRHLGVGVTVSTSSEHPYQLARRLSTLDHLTNGRLGWNVVTSFSDGAFRALGAEPLPRDERYARADDFMEVCYRLWDSWDRDAVVADPAARVYVDPAKVRIVDYKGPYYRSRAVFPVKPSPQGRPVIFQAGSSPEGREFAAKHAEIIFAIQLTAEQMRAFADDMRGRAAALGRDPDALRIIHQLQVVVAETDEAAWAKHDYLQSLVSVEGSLTIMSGIFGYDFSRLDPSQPLSDVDAPGVRAGLDSLLSKARTERGEWTLAEAARHYGLASGSPLVVGSPQTVADELERLLDEGDANGFNLLATDMPGSWVDFVDLVVPELQRRGRFRTEYRGATLRENFLDG